MGGSRAGARLAGLVFGILVRAACTSEPDPGRVLRSFSSDIAGPVLPGPARVRVRVVRRGKTQTNLHVELEQAGDVVAFAGLTLSGARPVDAPAPALEPPAEAVRSWREVPITPVGPPFGPVFAPHYEFRNLGPLPLSGASQAISAGFVRETSLAQTSSPRATGELDAPAITALLDTYWPALFSISPRPFAMTTVSFASQYLHTAGLSADEPLFFRAKAHVQSEGYCVEFRELWSRERLVALNQQTFAILR